MSQNLKKSLSVGHDYTSEDAPHTDRIIWYITQTLIQLADAAYKRNPKALIAYLADNYNANNNTNVRTPKSYTRVWRELLFLGFGGGWGGGGRRYLWSLQSVPVGRHQRL